MGHETFTPKVLHVLDHSLPLHSGYAFRSQNILQAQQGLGWQPIAVTSIKHQLGLKVHSTPSFQERIGGVQFYRSAFNARMVGDYAKQMQVVAQLYRVMACLIAREHPDLLHIHSPALNMLPALVLARKWRIPIVYEIRAFWEDAAVDHGTYSESSWKYKFVHALETWACRKANHLAVLCKGIKQDLRKRGIHEQHITIVPNGIHVDDFRPCPVNEELRWAWGLVGKTVIGFVGSFYRYEGLALLVEAFAQLTKNRDNLVLLLVGGGEVNKELQRQVNRLSLGSQVVFTGRIPHEEVPGVYGLFDILVYPRNSIRLTELVTPLKPLEAMAMGKPVVASDIGGHRELIRDGQTGVLFQSGDLDSLVKALEGLIAEPTRVRRLVEQGRAWVLKERSWETIIKRYIPAYECVIQKKEPCSPPFSIFVE